MKTKPILFVLVLFVSTQTFAQESCLTTQNLIELDAAWEKAQLESNYDFINQLLAEDFIWVHNHANTIDDKEAVLNRVQRYIANGTQNARSRNSNNVQVIISGSTAVLSGFTVVDRGPSPTNYNFMRTYVETDGICLLLASHTMAVPNEE